MALDLDRLAALEAEATPGPWQWVDPDTDLPCLPDAPCATGDHDRHVYRFSLRTVARFPTDYVGPLPKFVIHLAEEFSEHEQSDGSWTHPDAQLITEARNALPELISASRRAGELEAERDAAASHLRLIANDLRAAGDVPLVMLRPDGVTPAMISLADELWLVALNLDHRLADGEEPDQ